MENPKEFEDFRINFNKLKLSLKGLNSYYFLINDRNNELRQHFDDNYINNFNVNYFIKSFECKKEVFSDLNIDYYYFIVPDKSVVCKKFLPFNHENLKRNINSINWFVDFADILNPNDYFCLDSHINYNGGKILTFHILNHIDKSLSLDLYNNLLIKGKNKRIIHKLDLLTPKNWSYSEEEKSKFNLTEDITIQIPSNLNDLSNDLPEELKFDGVRKTEFFRNKESFSNKRALIFGDSSTNLLKWYFSFYFKEVIFYWDHGNLNKEIISWFNPDIIIELRTERLLDNIPTPTWVQDKIGVKNIPTIKNKNEIVNLKNNKNFIFSIITAFYNIEEYIEESIESIINQDFGFEDNVQLILIDDGSTDNSYNIALKYQKKYPDNILLLSKGNSGQASARNLGLQYATGKYLNFLDGDDKLSLNTLNNVYKFFSKHDDEIDMVAIPIHLFERSEGEHRLNYKFIEEKIVDLEEDPHFCQLSAASAFFKRDNFIFDFDTNVLVLEDTLLINKLLLEKKKYGVVNKCKYWYRQRFIRNSSVDSMRSNKKYYTHRFEHFFKNLIKYSLYKEDFVPKFIQYVMLYDFQWTLDTAELNIFETEEELKEFWNLFEYILNYIDEDVILNFKLRGFSKTKKQFLIYQKYKNDFSIITRKNNVGLKAGKHNIDNLKKHKIWLDIIDLRDNTLNISGGILSHFYNESLKVIATVVDNNGNKKEFESKYINYSTSRKSRTILSIPWDFYYNFDIRIPINQDNYKINLKVIYEENGEKISIKMGLKFKEDADLSEYGSYSIRKSRIILHMKNTILILPYSYKKMIKLEIKSLLKIIRSLEEYFIYALFIRFINLIIFPIMKNKEIWLFLDRPDFADDNSKHLFSYAVKQDDNINKYFILNKDSPDFKKMKNINKNIIPFGSLKHKILHLLAEKFIISYVNIDFINPFYGYNRKFYAGLIHSKKYFLPHGTTKEDVSKMISKYRKNFSLFVTSGDYERNSLINENYNYDEEILPILGLPRRDGLNNENFKKQVLITPSWRMDLKNKPSEYILQSPYFLRLNSLFNNEKLINYLEEKEYKLVFKPHPEVLEFIHLFDSENIIISTEETYHELLNPSPILITDYSGTFFDFGYLKKPIIYYQGDEDYHYEEGYWDYETMGFGDVITTEEDLVNKIIEYIENGCNMEDKYKERVDDFFKYIDQNNCKRNYEWIVKH